MEKKTALYEKHIAAGGKMVPFAGYLLPVQYADGILAEHKAVRQAAGLFDVSHMGEFALKGGAALPFLNEALTNDFTSMQPGQARYSPMCYEDGGTVDDLLVYKNADGDYLIVVNAANKDKDFAWMRARLPDGATLGDVSDGISQLALQGPCAAEILREVAADGSIPGKYYRFVRGEAAGVSCLVSKTGYTGEEGYELYCENKDAPALWDAVLEAGKPFGLIPCGLGARDTLRLEAGMPLYGHELSAEVSPREAGLSMFIKMEKPSFVGREALERPAGRKRIGLELTERGIAREGAKVFADGREVGVVTSGTMSPTLGRAIAMALVDAGFAGEEAEADVRGRRLHARVVPLPFYSKK